MGSSITTSISLAYYGGLAANSITLAGLLGPFSFAGGIYPGTGGTCQATISAPCVLQLAFTPTASGPASDTAVLQYNDGNGNLESVSLQLQGTGIEVAPAVLSFNPSSYNFGTVILGAHSTTTISVTRTGTLTASSMAITGMGETLPLPVEATRARAEPAPIL